METIYFPLTVTIGERGQKAGSNFQLLVATPEALRSRAGNGDYVLAGRATLVVTSFSWHALRKAVEEIVASCTGRDLDESVEKLRRYFDWEYEA